MEEEPSQYSSGCESGWTVYLGQSCGGPASLLDEGVAPDEEEEKEEEEEDLSMVSDASSGPPHAHDDDDCSCYHGGENNSTCFFSASSTRSPPVAAPPDRCWKRRRVETRQGNQRHSAVGVLLDDTASAPFLGFSGNLRCLLLQQQSYESASFGNSLNKNLGIKKTLVEEALEFSQGFSATYLKGKTTMQKPLHYVEPTSANSVKSHFVGN